MNRVFFFSSVRAEGVRGPFADGAAGPRHTRGCAYPATRPTTRRVYCYPWAYVRVLLAHPLPCIRIRAAVYSAAALLSGPASRTFPTLLNASLIPALNPSPNPNPSPVAVPINSTSGFGFGFSQLNFTRTPGYISIPNAIANATTGAGAPLGALPPPLQPPAVSGGGAGFVQPFLAANETGAFRAAFGAGRVVVRLSL